MGSESALSPDGIDALHPREASSADIHRHLDAYFSIYHPAYPILHEATFRARVAGTGIPILMQEAY